MPSRNVSTAADAATARQARAEPVIFAAALQRLVASTPGVLGAVLAGVSGNEVTSTLGRPVPCERLAAMAGTLLAPAGAMLEHADVGECRQVLIESSHGAVVVMGVGSCHGHGELLLACLTDHSAMLGQVQWAARRCCNQLRLAAQAFGTGEPTPSSG